MAVFLGDIFVTHRGRHFARNVGIGLQGGPVHTSEIGGRLVVLGTDAASGVAGIALFVFAEAVEAVEKPVADVEGHGHAARRLVEEQGEGRPFLEGKMVVNLKLGAADADE